jgi:hypothetical protein
VPVTVLGIEMAMGMQMPRAIRMFMRTPSGGAKGRRPATDQERGKGRFRNRSQILQGEGRTDKLHPLWSSCRDRSQA